MVWLQRLIPGLWWWKIPQVLTRKYLQAPSWPGAHHTQPCQDKKGELVWEDTQEPMSRNHQRPQAALVPDPLRGSADTLHGLGAGL